MRVRQLYLYLEVDKVKKPKAMQIWGTDFCTGKEKVTELI